MLRYIGAMKVDMARIIAIIEFCVLPSSWAMAAHGGIPEAPNDSGPPLFQTPVSQLRVAFPPYWELPAGRVVPDAPAGRPRDPNAAPLPVPAPTMHYAGPAWSRAGDSQDSAGLGNKRVISFFTTA